MKKLKHLIWPMLLKAIPAYAIADPTNPGLPGGDLKDLISKISTTILLLVGAVAVLFIILGGFQYISSAGNPDSIGKAKNTILYAVIGIIAVLLSYAIVQFIISQFPS